MIWVLIWEMDRHIATQRDTRGQKQSSASPLPRNKVQHMYFLDFHNKHGYMIFIILLKKIKDIFTMWVLCQFFKWKQIFLKILINHIIYVYYRSLGNKLKYPADILKKDAPLRPLTSWSHHAILIFFYDLTWKK